MTAKPPQAISLFADGFAIQNRRRIIEFGMSHRVPGISGWPVFAQSSAFCTYGPRLVASYRRLAYYVDRVLKGAKSAQLPIEQPTEFELVSLKTAHPTHTARSCRQGYRVRRQHFISLLACSWAGAPRTEAAQRFRQDSPLFCTCVFRTPLKFLSEQFRLITRRCRQPNLGWAGQGQGKGWLSPPAFGGGDLETRLRQRIAVRVT